MFLKMFLSFFSSRVALFLHLSPVVRGPPWDPLQQTVNGFAFLQGSALQKVGSARQHFGLRSLYGGHMEQ